MADMRACSIHPRTPTYTHTLSLAHTHTHPHTHTHSPAHTHTLTRTHTHSPAHTPDEREIRDAWLVYTHATYHTHMQHTSAHTHAHSLSQHTHTLIRTHTRRTRGGGCMADHLAPSRYYFFRTNVFFLHFSRILKTHHLPRGRR